MKETLSQRLHHRELTELPLRTKSHRKLYGDRQLIDNLDIVNELEGHTGCVNALSWSKSGALLASGSDDQHLNIHKYQPDNENSQFKLTTTVATGHQANIFSVKFMPHSSDRTVVTCAGDAEVRVFDLEYAGHSTDASRESLIAAEGRRRRRANIYNGVRYLTDGDTDCRVYRSHRDRVKRIVTENSPYLFLTCSEDGDVRQWDSRQPSSHYPAPRDGRYNSGTASSAPPPLISYRRYQLDLNSISCSPSQPHYIALGGAHLHAFLHDRRMTGRDRLREAGKTLSPSASMTAEEEELMSQATQCVRKFAPSGKQKMGRTDNGHITALKISDARPNEMIASWSGDHIYSFDLRGSPDDLDEQKGSVRSGQSSRVKESNDRKRKRHTSATSLSATVASPPSRPRTSEGEEGHEVAVRIRYRNGQSEDIPLVRSGRRRPGDRTAQQSDAAQGTTNVVFLTAQQRDAQRLARSTTKIRSSLFGTAEEGESAKARYTATLSHAAAILTDIDQAMRDWGYPIDPSPEVVRYQRTLRQNRESVRRFVQAAGTLARALGGRLQTPSGNSPLLASFASIETWRNDVPPSHQEQFGYDFLKAILLWLQSGIGELIEGFTRPEEMAPSVKAARRLPIPATEASAEAIEDYLVPYLLALAGDQPVPNLEANRFEVDANTQLFPSEKAAVLAFAAAVKIPFADLSSAVVLADGADYIQAQDRQTAMKYWGTKVARGVLLNAAEGVDFTFVDRAFGGLGRVIQGIGSSEAGIEPVVRDEEEEQITAVETVDENGATVDGAIAEDIAAAARAARETERNGDSAQESDVPMNEFGMPHDEGHMQATVEDDDNDDSDDNDDDENMDDDEDNEDPVGDSEADSSDLDEEDGVPNTGMHRFMYASAYERQRLRHKVARDVPCSAPFRSFRGHCNVKTVKDVNYFGLDDEYVVSGSDDGNFFIWDAKTSELVNVLEGDGEVVNVMQGHPYEPMLAVSGIDHTIKIFSPDARAREAARLARGISAADSENFSSIAWPPRLGRRSVPRRHRSNGTSATTTSEPAVPASTAVEDDDEDENYVAPNGLASRKRMHDAYRITNQNDVERQGGNQDAFLTSSMLVHLARQIRARRAAERAVAQGEEGVLPGEDDEEEERTRIILGDDCTIQ